MAEASKKNSGPKARHIPQRTCIACRRTDTKRGLIRIVRDASGRLAVDPTGRRNGRGAYLCHDPACWESALKRHTIERALRITTLHPDDHAALADFARGLQPGTDAPEPGQAERA
ncbi:MAG: YlxR family protein [Chloroflexales bacterium]|nr:YlxR family protein [Chloroflexales bacterium]